MAQIILKSLTICLLMMFNPLMAQQIWQENFSIPGKGIYGAGDGSIYTEMSGITKWSIEYSGIILSNEDDYAKTVTTSGGRFEARDINGEVCWRSEWIHIAGHEKVRIELTSAETGSGANISTKYMKSYYIIDGGKETLFHENGENAGNWGTLTSSCNDLSGDSVRIVCYLSNHYSADKVILDEVVVLAEEKNYPPSLPGELLLNEILFNPYPGGEDYVEIYNASDREIPAGKLFLASRDHESKLIQVCSLGGSIHLISPGSYFVVTMDTSKVFPFYRIKNPDFFQQVSAMPSFNNDNDCVVLLNENLEVLDELYYMEKMHSPFLADKEGVSLERVSLTTPSEFANNWYSASGDAGYGTPGYENSQTQLNAVNIPLITFEPESFSPDNNGFNDVYMIRYQLNEPGFLANISIFDASGHHVHHLAKNVILGISGEFTWNGEDESGRLQSLGVYVVLVELFNSKGNVFRFKDGVVLTGVLK